MKFYYQWWEDQVLSGAVLKTEYALCWKFWNCEIILILLQNGQVKNMQFLSDIKGLKKLFLEEKEFE